MVRVIFISIIVLLFGCKKEFTIVEIGSNNLQNDSIAPGDFAVDIRSVTDARIIVGWTFANGSSSYEIAINDSVVAYDQAPNGTFTLTGLCQNTLYKVSVIAVDIARNTNVKSLYVRTLKSYLDKILCYKDPLKFHSYSFNISCETKDSCMLIAGVRRREDIDETPNLPFLIKLDSHYNVIWEKEYNWGGGGGDMRATADGGFLYVLDDFIVKLDQSGNEIWRFSRETMGNIHSFCSVSENPDGSIVYIGRVNPVKYPLGAGFYVGKLSFNGQLIWEKNELADKKIEPYQVVQKGNGKSLIAGSVSIPDSSYYNSFSDREMESSILLEINDNGDIITEKIWHNKYKGDDFDHHIYKLSNGNYALIANSYSVVQSYYNFVVRLLMVDDSYNLIWEKYFDESSLGLDGIYRDCIVLKDNSLVLLSNSGGVCLSNIDSNGNILWYRRNSNLSTGESFFRNSSDQYVIVGQIGCLFFINPNGYRN